MNSFYTKAIRVVIYIGIFLLPLWFLPITADVLDFNKQVLLIAAASLALTLYLIETIRTGYLSYRKSAFYLPLLIFLGSSGVALISSINRHASFFGFGSSRSLALLTLMSLSILFFLALATIQDRGKALKTVIGCSLVVTLLFGGLQLFGISLIPGFAEASFNTVGSPNALALVAALAMTFFVGWASHLSPGISASKILSYIGISSALFFLVLANWWVIWTIAFIGILSIVLWQSNFRFERRTLRLFIIPLSIIAIGSFLMISGFTISSLKTKLPTEVSPSHQLSYKIGLEVFKKRPLGYGLENFPVAYDALRTKEIVNSPFYSIRFTDAVSEVATLLTEGGALMLAAFAFVVAVYGRLFVEFMRHKESSVSPGAWAFSLSLIALFFLYPTNMTFMTLFFMGLALIALEGDGEMRAIDLENSSRYSFLSSILFIVGLVSVLAVGYFTTRLYIANVYLLKAVKAAELEQAIPSYVESIKYNSADNRPYVILSEKLLAGVAEDLKTGPKKDEVQDAFNARIQGRIESAIDLAIRSTTTDPANAQNWLNRGFVYQNLIGLIGGAEQTALDMYTESLNRNPFDPLAYYRRGNVYLATADFLQKLLAKPPKDANIKDLQAQTLDVLTKAEENFKQAVGLYNNYGQAVYNLAVVYERKGQLKDAIGHFETLVRSNPRDPSMIFQLGMLYYRAGRKPDALAAWQRSVELFPNYSNARWYLSLMYEERGELDKALKEVEEVDRLNPNTDLVKERLEQLRLGTQLVKPGDVLEQEPL